MFEGKFVKLSSFEEIDRNNILKLRNKNLENSINYKLFDFLDTNKDVAQLPIHIFFSILNKQKKILGYCGLVNIDWKNRNAEISIILSKNWQKRKKSKEILDLLTDYGFNELNLHRLWLEISYNTKKNTKFFKKMKFTEEAKLKQNVVLKDKFLDSLVYSKLEKEHHHEKIKNN